MEQGIELIKNSLIRILGGYTNKEIHELKRTINKRIKKYGIDNKLEDDEKQMLFEYRTDKLLRKGKSVIRTMRKEASK